MDNKRIASFKNKKIVCLGGGIGTVNLIKGLKQYVQNITIVVSMADDGGSAGRLRRLYSVPPPGDLVACIAAMSNLDPIMRELLLYRFSGNRYGSDYSLPGHKFGNLMFVALSAITGDSNKALTEMQRIFKASGKILPSSSENVSIWARTSVGEKVYREENIDLGRFTGKIERVYLRPANPRVANEVIDAINEAEVIIAGPGDLYTTTLPVLLVPKILSALKISKAKKVFVVNVASKVFETPDYAVLDYLRAIAKHCKAKIFDTILINNNHLEKIPKKYSRQYSYVNSANIPQKNGQRFIKADLVNSDFPLYHDSKKLAKAALELL